MRKEKNSGIILKGFRNVELFYSFSQPSVFFTYYTRHTTMVSKNVLPCLLAAKLLPPPPNSSYCPFCLLAASYYVFCPSGLRRISVVENCKNLPMTLLCRKDWKWSNDSCWGRSNLKGVLRQFSYNCHCSSMSFISHCTE